MERKGERVGAIVLLNNVYARLLQQSLKVKQVQVDEISPPLPRHTVASLRTVGMTSRTPLLFSHPCLFVLK